MQIVKNRRRTTFQIEIGDSGRSIVVSRGEAKLALRGKAVAFILALATNDFPAFLQRDELHRQNGWKDMSAASVGKQAARIVDQVNKAIGPTIEWDLKTYAWRLERRAIKGLRPATRQKAKAILAKNDWSRILRFGNVPVASVSRWVQLCGSALVDMTEGHAESGYDKLRQAHQLADQEAMVAIGDVLATRIGQAMPRPQLRIPGSAAGSEFLEAAEARRQAAYARMSSSAEWEALYISLHRALLRMIEIGDNATQAILFNAMAVLARRLGRIQEAIDCIREAAALAVFSGDFVLIQNVSFNFGNIISGMAKVDPEAFPIDTYLGLLDFDIELRARLNIGKDSAQAELLCAYLSQEDGRFDLARSYLDQAEPIIKLSRQPYDLALYQRIVGLCLCGTSAPGSSQFAEGLSALLLSIQVYSEHNNLTEAEAVRRDLEARKDLQILTQ